MKALREAIEKNRPQPAIPTDLNPMKDWINELKEAIMRSKKELPPPPAPPAQPPGMSLGDIKELLTDFKTGLLNAINKNKPDFSDLKEFLKALQAAQGRGMPPPPPPAAIRDDLIGELRGWMRDILLAMKNKQPTPAPPMDLSALSGALKEVREWLHSISDSIRDNRPPPPPPAVIPWMNPYPFYGGAGWAGAGNWVAGPTPPQMPPATLTPPPPPPQITVQEFKPWLNEVRQTPPGAKPPPPPPPAPPKISTPNMDAWLDAFKDALANNKPPPAPPPPDVRENLAELLKDWLKKLQMSIEGLNKDFPNLDELFKWLADLKRALAEKSAIPPPPAPPPAPTTVVYAANGGGMEGLNDLLADWLRKIMRALKHKHTVMPSPPKLPKIPGVDLGPLLDALKNLNPTNLPEVSDFVKRPDLRPILSDTGDLKDAFDELLRLLRTQMKKEPPPPPPPRLNIPAAPALPKFPVAPPAPKCPKNMIPPPAPKCKACGVPPPPAKCEKQPIVNVHLPESKPAPPAPGVSSKDLDALKDLIRGMNKPAPPQPNPLDASMLEKILKAAIPHQESPQRIPAAPVVIPAPNQPVVAPVAPPTVQIPPPPPPAENKPAKKRCSGKKCVKPKVPLCKKGPDGKRVSIDGSTKCWEPCANGKCPAGSKKSTNFNPKAILAKLGNKADPVESSEAALLEISEELDLELLAEAQKQPKDFCLFNFEQQ